MESCSACGGVGGACICIPGGLFGPEPAEGSFLFEQPTPHDLAEGNWEDSRRVYGKVPDYPWLRPQPGAGPPVPAVNRSRPSARVVAALVTALAVVAAAGLFFVAPARSSFERLGGAQMMHRSLAAAAKAGSAHATVSTSGAGQTVMASIDFSPAGGTETATLGAQTMTVVAVGGMLYMRADPSFLAQTLDVSNAVASQYGGRWISFPTDDQGLAQMVGQLKTSVVVSDLLTLAGPITKVGVQRGGRIALQGKLADNSYNDGSGAGDVTTLTVSTSAPFYPLSISYSDPDNGTTEMTFSHWGEHLDLATPQSAIPASVLRGGSTALPATAPDESTTPAPSITYTSDQPGVAVTPAQARTVATELWQAWVQARATRDITALQTLDAQPELSADWGYICQYTCAGPWLTLSSIAVTVPTQTKWPADFLATASYTTDCHASASPCNNTFVAVQAGPGSPWKIASMTDWSGNSYATTAPVVPGQLSPGPTPSPAAHVSTLPQEYAEYLQAIKTTGKSPADTRLASGAFTTSLISSNYYPESQQQADGLTDNITYYTNRTDPIWEFPGANGATAVCGAVRYTDVEKATTIPLSQSPDNHPFGNLATGTYSSVTMTGLHLVCFEVYSDPAQAVGVLGTWGEVVTATGTAIQAQTNPS